MAIYDAVHISSEPVSFEGMTGDAIVSLELLPSPRVTFDITLPATARALPLLGEDPDLSLDLHQSGISVKAITLSREMSVSGTKVTAIANDWILIGGARKASVVEFKILNFFDFFAREEHDSALLSQSCGCLLAIGA